MLQAGRPSYRPTNSVIELKGWVAKEVISLQLVGHRSTKAEFA